MAVSPTIVTRLNQIRGGENLYCVEPAEGTPNAGKIWKVDNSVFSSYPGDLLITQEGENGDTPRLFVVHWDGGNFVIREIMKSDSPAIDRFPVSREEVI